MDELEKKELQLQVECTEFFRNAPHASETCESLALQFGAQPEELLKVLDRLVALNILELAEDGPRSVFRYNLPKLTAAGDALWTNT